MNDDYGQRKRFTTGIRPYSNPIPAFLALVLAIGAAAPQAQVLEMGVTQATPLEPYLVKDINTLAVGSDPGGLTNVNGTLFFRAYDSSHGDELWKSNGTEAGTVMVKDISPGARSSWPWGRAKVDGTLFFGADDGSHGYELWALLVSPRVYVYLPVVLCDYP